MSKKQNINDRIFFVSCIIELYASKHNIKGNEAEALFNNKGMDTWLYNNYEILHTEDEKNVILEIYEHFGV